MRILNKCAGQQVFNLRSAGRVAVVFLVTSCCAPVCWSQTLRSFDAFPNPHCLELQKDRVNNEFAFTGRWEGLFYCNPLMLDGVALDPMNFNVESKGKLTLVKGDLTTDTRTEIPFRVRMRRDGEPVALPFDPDTIFCKIDIAKILKFAQNGDQLVIEPVNKEDWPAKRILRIGWGC